MSPRLIRLRFGALIALSLPVSWANASTLVTSSKPVDPVQGLLTILWGDGPPGTDQAPLRAMLTDDQGMDHSLALSDELLGGGLLRWNGLRVKVYPATAESAAESAGTLRVAAIQLQQQPRGSAVTGSQPWISLLCKFADIAAEPQDLAYFQDMYANAPGRLDHYWREQSYGAVDVVGSMAVDWVTLPGNQADYAPTPGAGNDADLNKVFDDCTAAVDDMVDFSGGGMPFVGINIMLNEDLDCCAWGGATYRTLDGVEKSWRTTWNPPWSFGNEAIIAHEMGHGFGLHHANNFDGDGNPYDSPWDVMSSATGYATHDATYGALGKHINAAYKDQLGWFAAPRRYEAIEDSIATIPLDHLALADATHYQAAVIPVSADYLYTVEARQRAGTYDSELPAAAVIITEMDLNRAEPGWAVDADVPPADYSDNPGTMWEPGETFIDVANGIAITVESETETGFVVTIGRPTIPAVFADGFDAGGGIMVQGAMIRARSSD